MHIAVIGFQRAMRMWRIAVLVAAVMVMAGAAGASDYVHQCRSADGNYVMNDEELQVFDRAKGYETGPSIPYKVLSKTVLSKSAGYCIARQAASGQRRYKHAASTYALQIRFRQNGQRIKTFMLCELASSGLPASYNCDREVTTLDWTIGQTKSEPGRGGGPGWYHNGSQVRIIAQGVRRRIVFVAPNRRLARLGVSAGDVLFDGRRDGNRYSGVAYAYTKRCRARAFDVSGRVEEGERRVVVRGSAPIFGRKCRIVDRRDARLVFDRQ